MRRKPRSAIAGLLVVVMILSPTMVYAQPPAAAPATQAASQPKLDLGYVTPDAVAAAVAHPRRLLTSPQAEMLPVEVVSALGNKELGIDPLQVEQILLIAEPPQAGPPVAGIVVRTASPIAQGRILGPVWDRTEQSQLEGKTYRQAKGMMDASIFRVDDRTLIVAHDALLRKMLANHARPQEGQMARVLGRLTELPDVGAIVLVEPLRPILTALLAMQPLPPPLAMLKEAPPLVSMVAAKANLIGEMSLSLTVRANDEAAAKQLEQIVDQMLNSARQAMLADVARQQASPDPVEQAQAKYAQRISGRMFEVFRPVRNGETLTLATSGQGAAPQIATIGILVALLLPAVQSAREAARRAMSTNNLKQIGVAMHNYLNTHNAFPARANFDKAGKPLLSWRVHLLPFLDQQQLYKAFHLDEPWDSQHNRQLVSAMPPLFLNPSAPTPPGKTPYLAVVGKGLMFEGNQGHKIGDLRDGTSNTIMVVEADASRAVPWTQPDDWQYDPQHPLAGLGSAHPGGFLALFADASVRFLSKSIDVDTFRALLTIDGGERVGSF